MLLRLLEVLFLCDVLAAGLALLAPYTRPQNSRMRATAQRTPHTPPHAANPTNHTTRTPAVSGVPAHHRPQARATTCARAGERVLEGLRRASHSTARARNDTAT
eukprot:1235702-Rhodomonas_salina.1